MKKRKIGDIILWIIVVIFLLNTLIAYLAYNEISNEKKPTVNFGMQKEEDTKIYNEGLYKVVVKEDDMMEEVSLKLFFLK